MNKIILLLFLVFSFYACNRQSSADKTGSEEITGELATIPLVLIDSTALSTASTPVKSFYEVTKYTLAWSNPINRQQLLSILDTLANHGIKIKAKELKSLVSWHNNYAHLAKDTLIEADINYSTVYLKTAAALYNGNLKPRRLYNDWDLDPKPIDTSTLLQQALSNEQIAASYDTLRPQHNNYINLRKKYAALTTVLKATLVPFPSAQLQDTISQLGRYKNHLAFLSFYPKGSDKNDIFTDELKQALLQFQAAKKIERTGTLNSETIQSIKNAEQYIEKKLLTNLERWKWFPRNFSAHYILINIPEYTVITVSNKDTIATHRAVVGTQKRKTPILSSILTTVVVNPTWTVPPTILKNDVVPKAIKDSTYFHRQNFALYNKSTGKEVAIKDWNASNYNAYRYVQRGGAGNTLGRIKFMFQNNHAVYFHDTPSKYQFSRTQRGLSSGCIRVEFPFKMAQFIFDLQGNEITKEELDELLASEKLRNFSAKKTPIHIHLLYWTADVNTKGEINYHNDIYEYDDELYKRLK